MSNDNHENGSTNAVTTLRALVDRDHLAVDEAFALVRRETVTIAIQGDTDEVSRRLDELAESSDNKPSDGVASNE